MWIKKSSDEVSAEKRTMLLRSTCLDALLGASLWYVLVRISAFFGLPYHGSASGYIFCGVIAIILPANWYASRRARRKLERTMVCDDCNSVKEADDQADCKCGGHYLPLTKMKWLSATSSDRPASMRACWSVAYTENHSEG